MWRTAAPRQPQPCPDQRPSLQRGAEHRCVAGQPPQQVLVTFGAAKNIGKNMDVQAAKDTRDLAKDLRQNLHVEIEPVIPAASMFAALPVSLERPLPELEDPRRDESRPRRLLSTRRVQSSTSRSPSRRHRHLPLILVAREDAPPARRSPPTTSNIYMPKQVAQFLVNWREIEILPNFPVRNPRRQRCTSPTARSWSTTRRQTGGHQAMPKQFGDSTC